MMQYGTVDEASTLTDAQQKGKRIERGAEILHHHHHHHQFLLLLLFKASGRGTEKSRGMR
jgi:hypothetical protein